MEQRGKRKIFSAHLRTGGDGKQKALIVTQIVPVCVPVPLPENQALLTVSRIIRQLLSESLRGANALP